MTMPNCSLRIIFFMPTTTACGVASADIAARNNFLNSAVTTTQPATMPTFIFLSSLNHHKPAKPPAGQVYNLSHQLKAVELVTRRVFVARCRNQIIPAK